MWTLQALGSALDYRAGSAVTHTRRAVGYASLIAREYGLSEPAIEQMTRGGLVHEIGKIGVPDAILSKTDDLTPEESALMRRHPRIGVGIVKDIPFFAGALPLIAHHEERWDGTGYPDGLTGEEIPVAARIFAVADALEVMTGDGPHAVTRSFTEALADINRRAGTRFDPAVVRACRRVPDSAFDGIRRGTDGGRAAPRPASSS
jgi:cyclic di-GMP phosphodiesterase